MRRLALPLLGLLLLAFVGIAYAQITPWVCPGLTRQVTPYAHETLTVSTVAKTLSASVYTTNSTLPQMAIVFVTGDAISSWPDGTAPTASTGQVNAVNTSFVVCGNAAITNFKAIRVTNDSTLSIGYYK